MKCFIIIIIVSINILQATIAQQLLFEKSNSEGLCSGAISAVDFDGNGHVDVVFSGKKGTASTDDNATYLYTGDGQGSFMLVMEANQFPGGDSQYWMWDDFNGDGKLDLFNSGVTAGRESGYFNSYLMSSDYCLEESDPFSSKPTKRYGGSHVIADLDNDGLMDYIHLYQAQGNVHIVRFQDAANDSAIFDLRRMMTKIDNTTMLTQVNSSRIDLIDFNHDGYLDFLISGHIEYPTPSQKYIGLFINNGDRTFREHKFPHVIRGNTTASMFVDMNGDGAWDLVQSAAVGGTTGFPLTYYKNVEGDLQIKQSFSEVYRSMSVSSYGVAADINNDGYYDIIIAGNNNGSPQVRSTAFYIYNTVNGQFEKNETLSASIPGLDYPVVEVIDADNDGILDFAIQGRDNDGVLRYGIYKNTTYTATNNPPSAPANLSGVVDGSMVTLSWGAASDDKTPSASLTYNLYLKNTTTGKYVIHPRANLTTGKRQLYDFGNAYMAKTKTMTLPDGVYEWSLQAIDAAYAGGQFAGIRTFTIGDPNDTDFIAANETDISLIRNNDRIWVKGIEHVESIELYNPIGHLLSKVSNSSSVSCRNCTGIFIVKVKAEEREFIKKIVL